MQMIQADAGKSQKPRGNDLSVRNNHNDIGAQTRFRNSAPSPTDLFRLVDMQIVAASGRLDRRAADNAARGRAAFRLRDDAFDGNAGSAARRRSGVREFGVPTKDDAHGGHRALRITTRRFLPQFADAAFDQSLFSMLGADEQDAIQVSIS